MFICMYLCICFVLEESQLLLLSTSDASGTSAVLILGEDWFHEGDSSTDGGESSVLWESIACVSTSS